VNATKYEGVFQPEVVNEATGESSPDAGLRWNEGDHVMERFASINDPKHGLAALRHSAIEFAMGQTGEA
jgi:hypothetical protein